MRRRTTLLVAGDTGQRLHLAVLIGPDLAYQTICGAERWDGGRETWDAWEALAFDKPLCRRCRGRVEELVRLADLVVKPDLTEKAALAAWAGVSDCICYPGGAVTSTYEGPQEDCPVHGRPYGEWVERAAVASARAEKAEAQLERWVGTAGAAAEEVEVLVDFMRILLGEHYGPGDYPDEPGELMPLMRGMFVELRTDLADATQDAENAEAAVARVRALHTLADFGGGFEDPYSACKSCWYESDDLAENPCPTLRALDGETP